MYKTDERSKEVDVTCKITKHIAVLSTQRGGWSKELNLVSWSGNDPKYDIRGWNDEHTKCTKGISLSSAELSELKDTLNSLDI